MTHLFQELFFLWNVVKLPSALYTDMRPTEAAGTLSPVCPVELALLPSQIPGCRVRKCLRMLFRA